MQGELDLGDIPARVKLVKSGARPAPGRPASSVNQLWLPGCAPTHLDRLFFALRPDEQAANAILRQGRSIKREAGLQGGLIDKECLHVSMQGIGAYEGVPNDICRKAAEAAQSVEAQAFDVCFDRVMRFQGEGRRAIVLLAGGDFGALLQLHRLLGESMRKAGLGKRVSRSLTPHVTMLYDSRPVGEKTVPPVRWKIDRFFLIHSLQGHSRHVVLHERRLLA